MSGKPWLEKHDHADVRETLVEEGYTEEWVALFTAAPAMARALCFVEWEGLIYGDSEPCCPSCHVRELPDRKHNPSCELDATLKAAGLDAAAREEVRRMR